MAAYDEMNNYNPALDEEEEIEEILAAEEAAEAEGFEAEDFESGEDSEFSFDDEVQDFSFEEGIEEDAGEGIDELDAEHMEKFASQFPEWDLEPPTKK